MKFKFVKNVEGSVPTYNGKKVKTGQEIDLSGHFAEKAKKNPDFEQVEAKQGEE